MVLPINVLLLLAGTKETLLAPLQALGERSQWEREWTKLLFGSFSLSACKSQLLLDPECARGEASTKMRSNGLKLQPGKF